MEGVSLKSRAIAFAASAGAAVFILALVAGSGANLAASNDISAIGRALIGAILCAVLCWASAQRAVAGVAGSVDIAIERLLSAANGDLEKPVSEAVRRDLPDLAVAMESLFSQVRTNLDSVQTLALFDPVTQLPNRTSFCRQVERALLDRETDGPAALFFIDLDGFKGVNDTLGHAAGDQLLARVAGRLREVVMSQAPSGAHDAIIGRLGGDEFTLFFPTLAGRGAAQRIGRAVQFAMGESFAIGSQQVDLGASLGVAFYPDQGDSLAALLRSADIAMYHAKAGGRGRMEFYRAELADALADKAALEHDLRIAVQRDEFILQFQPQVDVSGERIETAEALLRWAHPGRDLMLPATFVPLAEETGVIVPLGDWVMDRVCETAARWHRCGITQRIAMNISTRELVQVDFFHRLRTAMERHATPANALELEITETLAMDMNPRVVAEVTALREEGVRVAIDDFGTGYSNLARLKDLPIDRVKIDRSLVRDIIQSADARTICSAVVGLVHGLGLEIVIEGVETQDQIDMLRVLGCRTFQGYHLARPVDEPDYIDRFGNLGRMAKVG